MKKYLNVITIYLLIGILFICGYLHEENVGKLKDKVYENHMFIMGQIIRLHSGQIEFEALNEDIRREIELADKRLKNDRR